MEISQPVEAAAIYCRISQDRTGEGTAVETQKAECLDLAEKLGLTVAPDRHYIDNDVSATTGKRREHFEQLLEDCEAGRISHIIAHHVDRLYRLPRDLERLVHAVSNHDIAVRGVHSGVLDLSTPAGRMNALMIAGMGRYEVEQKSVRQRSQSTALAKSGAPRRGGHRPFGFEEDGVTIRESEAQHIRQATARLLDGASVLSIIREWNRERVKTARADPLSPKEIAAKSKRTPTSGKWNHSSFVAVMTRWRNAGVRQHLGEPLVDATWPAIVSREDLEALRLRFADPRRLTTTDHTRKHLLSFLLVCGKCGDRLRAGHAAARGNGYPIYQCPGANGCRLAVSYEVAETVVMGHVAARLALPDWELLNATDTDRAVLKVKQREHSRLTRDADAVERSTVSRARKLRQLEEIESEQSALRHEIDRLRQRLALASLIIDHKPVVKRGRASFDRAEKARASVLEGFAALDLHNRRAIIKALCRIEVMPAVKGVRYTKRNSGGRIAITPLDPMTGEALSQREDDSVLYHVGGHGETTHKEP